MAVTVEDEEGHVVGFAVLDVWTPSFGRSEKGAHVILRSLCEPKCWYECFSPPRLYTYLEYSHPANSHCDTVIVDLLPTLSPTEIFVQVSQFTSKLPYLTVLRNSSGSQRRELKV